MLRRSWQCADIDPDNVVLNEDFIINQTNDPENELYFYHTDHLGSSSWITDASGAVNQHIQYLPFGESFISQKVSSYDVRYKFTGKERDAETGYVPKAFGIGARYYSSELSVWLSVDPLASRYPNESPYCYAGLNPVMITDPNGMWKDPTEAKKTQEEATAKYGAARVGKVYNANAGTDKEADYRFNVYKVGEDKYVHKTEDGAEFGYVPDVIVSDDYSIDDYNNYSDNYTQFGSYQNYQNYIFMKLTTPASGRCDYSTINVETFFFGGRVVIKAFARLFLGDELKPVVEATPKKMKYPGNDPSRPPKGYEWRGKPGSKPGSQDGNWYNPNTGESLRPDLNHPNPIGPHWDYRSPAGKWYRIFPDETVSPKIY
jgi:RHS repeat-associated protein